MANEIRRRYLAIGGLVEDNPLASGATTLTSAGLAALPAVGSTEHVAIVFDPDNLEGAPFVKYITAHAAAATTATITAAAQEGTTVRAVSQDIPWVHAATPLDISTVVARQGGSSTDWSASGTSSQPLPAKVVEQVGALPYSALNSGATISLTFPAAFANVPIMSAICGPTFVTDTNVVPSITAITTTGATILIWSRTNLNNLGGTVHWRALGEMA